MFIGICYLLFCGCENKPVNGSITLDTDHEYIQITSFELLNTKHENERYYKDYTLFQILNRNTLIHIKTASDYFSRKYPISEVKILKIVITNPDITESCIF